MSGQPIFNEEGNCFANSQVIKSNKNLLVEKILLKTLKCCDVPQEIGTRYLLKITQLDAAASSQSLWIISAVSMQLKQTHDVVVMVAYTVQMVTNHF